MARNYETEIAESLTDVHKNSIKLMTKLVRRRGGGGGIEQNG
jgi:hypothetical protein